MLPFLDSYQRELRCLLCIDLYEERREKGMKRRTRKGKKENDGKRDTTFGQMAPHLQRWGEKQDFARLLKEKNWPNGLEKA